MKVKRARKKLPARKKLLIETDYTRAYPKTLWS